MENVLENTIKIDRSNWFKFTRGTWSAVNNSLEYWDAYKKWRRSRKKGNVNLNGTSYEIYESLHKSIFGRSFSIYFIADDHVIRISDHWSETEFAKSRKLNCGIISTCVWKLFGAQKLEVGLPGETYVSTFLIGKIYFSNLTYKYVNYKGE